MNDNIDRPELAALILEQAPDAIIFAGADGLIQEWNAAAEQIFGHSRDEALGESLDIIIPERFRDAHWRGYEAAISTGVTKLHGKAMPTRSMRKDGTTIYVELSFGVVLGSAGAAIGALAVARDITEKFLAERANRDAADGA